MSKAVTTCIVAFLVGMGATLVMMQPEADVVMPKLATISAAPTTSISKSVEAEAEASTEVLDSKGEVIGTVQMAAVGSDTTEESVEAAGFVVEAEESPSTTKPAAPVAASQDVPLAQNDDHKKEWSLALTFFVGFKPVYYETEGDGRYGLMSLAYTRRFSNGLGISVSVPVVATQEPKEVAVADPTISVSKGLVTLPGNIPVGAKLAFKPGVSQKSREADYHGSVSAGLSVSKTASILTAGMAARYTRRMHRYTFNALGITNYSHSESASGYLSLQLPGALSLTGSLAYIRSVPYEGDPNYIFSNGIDLTWQASDAVVISTGLSRTDSQLQPNGEDNNVFTVYKQNQTEMYLSVTYAL